MMPLDDHNQILNDAKRTTDMRRKNVESQSDTHSTMWSSTGVVQQGHTLLKHEELWDKLIELQGTWDSRIIK